MSASRRLATGLNSSLARCAVVLHDRFVPGARIAVDHLVIGPNGIWLIDAKADRGRLESRDRDSWSRADDRLYVGGRNRTDLVMQMESTINAVRRALEPIGYGGSPVNGAICFPNATWPPLCPAFQLDGVWVTDPSTLTPLLLGPTSFSDVAIHVVGHHLRDHLAKA